MEWTIKEFAAREQVTERAVRNWIYKGAVDVRRTPGGRIRIVEHRSEHRRGVVILTLDDRQYSEDSGKLST